MSRLSVACLSGISKVRGIRASSTSYLSFFLLQDDNKNEIKGPNGRNVNAGKKIALFQSKTFELSLANSCKNDLIFQACLQTSIWDSRSNCDHPAHRINSIPSRRTLKIIERVPITISNRKRKIVKTLMTLLKKRQDLVF